MPPVTVNRPSFNVSLIERNGNNLIANLTSTLQVTASRTFMRNVTTVMCLSGTREMGADNFTVAGKWFIVTYVHMYIGIITYIPMVSLL